MVIDGHQQYSINFVYGAQEKWMEESWAFCRITALHSYQALCGSFIYLFELWTMTASHKNTRLNMREDKLMKSCTSVPADCTVRQCQAYLWRIFTHKWCIYLFFILWFHAVLTLPGGTLKVFLFGCHFFGADKGKNTVTTNKWKLINELTTCYVPDTDKMTDYFLFFRFSLGAPVVLKKRYATKEAHIAFSLYF